MNHDRNKYIVHGPVPLVPIANGTAGQQLFDALRRYEHLSTAVICAETHEIVSYRKLWECSCRLASSLKQYGLGPGSIISMLSENSTYYYYPVLASLFLGITVAPLSPDYVGKELEHAINISKPELLFCSKRTLEKATSLKKTFNFLQKVVVLDLSENTEGAECLNNFMVKNLDVDTFRPSKFDPVEQVAFILCSSGTTGLPKGVMITHRNLTVKFAQMSDPVLGFVDVPGTTVLSILPMFHVGGLVLALVYLILGFRNITMKKYSPEPYLRLAQDYKVEVSFIAPPIMAMLAKDPLVDRYDLSSLKEMLCGAAPLSRELIVDVLKRLPNLKEIRQAYGLTETTLSVTFSPRGDAKIGSSGKLYPFVSAKVLDLNTGKTLGPYRHGELCFKGEEIMKGYTGIRSPTENVIDQDGWLHSGDIGYYDRTRHFFIVDRIKELIKYKAYQVSPTELESLLVQHPKIKDVAVIGIDDPIAGQLPRAYVVKVPNAELTEKEVAEFVAGQVSHQKHLRGGVVFVNEIPRISSGKIARKSLRELSQRKPSKL